MKDILQVIYNIVFFILIIIAIVVLKNCIMQDGEGVEKDDQDYIYEYKYDDDGRDNGRRDGII